MEDYASRALSGGWGMLPGPELLRSIKMEGNENWIDMGAGGGSGCGRGDVACTCRREAVL